MPTTEQAIDQRLAQMESQFFAVGVVTAISGAILTVSVRGSSIQCHKLASYTPVLNDVVQLAWPPGRPFVLGKLG